MLVRILLSIPVSGQHDSGLAREQSLSNVDKKKLPGVRNGHCRY
jgi:hypothetical protein